MRHTKELIRQIQMNQPRVTSEEAYRQMEEHMRAARAKERSEDRVIVFAFPAKEGPPQADGK